MHSPRFWQEGGWQAAALAPLGWLWGAGGRLRWALVRPYHAGIPVICVGNLVVGGTGKTPITIAIAEYLRGQGLAPHLLSRGYGGSAKGPMRVDPARHDARQVGDEALLLAAHGPTWVGADRARSARAAAAAGAGCLLLDDGLQNPTLAKDLSLVVVDGGQGFGNGRLVPAGPLREPVGAGLKRASAVLLIGRDEAGVAGRLPPELPCLRARLAPGPELDRLQGHRVLAFAGIGRPEKFFTTLKEAGLEVARAKGFPDHHPYREAELRALSAEAAAAKARLVTTEKDAMRLPPAWRAEVKTVPVHVEWEDPPAFEALLRPFLA